MREIDVKGFIVTEVNEKEPSLLTKLVDRFRRAPDQKIQRDGKPYLDRWYLIPHNKYFNVYLHHFLQSDHDAALHDHPWDNLSILLTGAYKEWVVKNPKDKHYYGDNLKCIHRRQGAVVFRRATCAHRIELYKMLDQVADIIWETDIDRPVWTIFITGPKYRDWGFHCLKEWVHNVVFDKLNGCGD